MKTKKIAKYSLLLWICTFTILPPAVGYLAKFRDNIYQHGVEVLNAHLSGKSYACGTYAESIAFSKDYKGFRGSAKKWFEKAYFKSRNNSTQYLNAETIRAFMFFSLAHNERERAKEVYKWFCLGHENNEYINKLLTDTLDTAFGTLAKTYKDDVKYLIDRVKNKEEGKISTTNTASVKKPKRKITANKHKKRTEKVIVKNNNGLIATGTYTICDGHSYSVDGPIPYTLKRTVQVNFYKDAIEVDNVYMPYNKESGGKKEYGGSMGTYYYVSGNYEMYMEIIFNHAFGTMITTYPMRKGKWNYASQSNSGYSNSNDIETNPIHTPCRACKMTGKCNVCKGSGQTKTKRVYNYDLGIYELEWTTCKTCNGTGVCIGCGGDGYIDDEDL